MTHYKTYSKGLTEKEARYIISGKATTNEKNNLIIKYLNWLEEIGYWVKESSDEYLGDNYVELILEGIIPSSETVYQACERYIWEIENQGTDLFPYVFDKEEVEKFIRFTNKNFNVSNEQREVQPIILQPHQHFRLGQIFGWKDMLGNRRFNMSFDLLGRGNGKTTEKIPIPLMMMVGEGKKTVQTVLLAGTEEQTKVPFGIAKNMVNNAKKRLQQHFKVLNEEIRIDRSQNRYKEYDSWLRMSTNTATSSHGGAVSMALFDEVHTYKNSEVINTIMQSFTKSVDSVAVFTSTRSAGYSQVLEDLVSEGVDALENYKTNTEYERSFYFIAQLEDVKELKDFRNWIKANPNIMYQNNLFNINQYIKFKKNPKGGDAVDFFTQQFNFIDTTDSYAYIPITMIKKNKGTFEKSKLKGREAYIGVDLGGDDDFSYVSVIVPEYIEGDKKLYVFGKAFITETNFYEKTEINNSNFEDLEYWYQEGLVEIMPDDERNEAQVYEYIKKIMSEYNVLRIGWDPNGVNYIRKRLEDDNKTDKIVDVAQRRQVLDQPLRDLRDIFMVGGVNYNKDPLLEYFIRNSMLLKDGKATNSDGLWSISKPESSKVALGRAKIDGVASITCAMKAFIDDGGFYVLEKGVSNPYDIKPFYTVFKEMNEKMKVGGDNYQW